MLKRNLELEAKLEQILSSPGTASVSPAAEARTIANSGLEEARALEIARLRTQGQPLQHLLGFQFFYSHEYRVNASTLIPRPETEILVDAVLKNSALVATSRMAELGTGTGAIAGEILSHRPQFTAVVSDAVKDALTLAQENFERLRVLDRVQILPKVDLQSGFEVFEPCGPFDLVISNPPYVSRQDEIAPDVLFHEPATALFPPQDPNFFYLNFIEHAAQILKHGGFFYFEVPHERADFLEKKFQAHFEGVELLMDLTGRPRVLKGRR